MMDHKHPLGPEDGGEEGELAVRQLLQHLTLIRCVVGFRLFMVWMEKRGGEG